MPSGIEHRRREAADTRHGAVHHVADAGFADGRQLGLEGLVDAAAAGFGAQQIAERVAQMIPRTHLFAVIKDLRYGVRGGRAPKLALPLQRYLGLVPLIRSKPNGRLGIGGALFGRDRLPERFAAALARRLDPRKSWRLLVCHCDCPEDGEAFRRALRARIPQVEADWLIETGSGIGAHAGPGSLVVGVQEAVPLPSRD